MHYGFSVTCPSAISEELRAAQSYAGHDGP